MTAFTAAFATSSDSKATKNRADAVKAAYDALPRAKSDKSLAAQALVQSACTLQAKLRNAVGQNRNSGPVSRFAEAATARMTDGNGVYTGIKSATAEAMAQIAENLPVVSKAIDNLIIAHKVYAGSIKSEPGSRRTFTVDLF